MVFQDGGGYVSEDGRWRAPIVFDNLIHKSEMPVTIGVFVNPGVLTAAEPATRPIRYNRSFEYDALGDRYARFLLEELLPEVGKQPEPDRRPERAARSAARQQRRRSAPSPRPGSGPTPSAASLSFIGTYADLRGGNDLSDADPQDGAEAAPRLPAGRQPTT